MKRCKEWGNFMDINNDKLIELNKRILENEKVKISFKEIFFSKPVIVSLIILVLEVLAAVIANCNSENQTVIKISAYSILILSTCHLLYIFYGCFSVFKEMKHTDLYSSLVENFYKRKIKKEEIFELLSEIENEDKNKLIEYYNYIKQLINEKQDSFSFLFDGLQNVGLFSAFIFILDSLKNLSTIIENNNLFEILTYLIPLGATILVIMEKFRFLKYKKISYCIEEYFESKK